MISGGVATGKTALMRDFAAHAAAGGALHLAATASLSESEYPFGVVRQLLRDLPGRSDGIEALLDEVAGWDTERTADAGGRATAGAMHELTVLLLDHATRDPVLITVDDVDYADAPSLRFLLYLARRQAEGRLLTVLTEPAAHASARVVFHAELAHLPEYRRIRLGPLSSGGTRALLGDRLPSDAAARLTPAAQAVSGGNPLLVRALADDQAQRSDGSAPLVVGPAYREALLNCLYRREPEFLRVARAIAVLDGPLRWPTVGRLADVDGAAAAQIVDVLNASGLLHEGNFRHPEARSAVLRSHGSGPADVHHRAAAIMHQNGATPTAVAHHLVAAAVPPEAWAVPVLNEAAHEAVSAGDPQLAIQQLRVARMADVSHRQRLAVQCTLAQIEWEVDPAAAARHLPDLLAATADGALSARNVLATVRNLLWHGRADAAVTALRQLVASRPDMDRTALRATEVYLSSFFPDTAPALPDLGPAVTPRLDDALPAISTLWEEYEDASDPGCVARAEQLLDLFRTGSAGMEAAFLGLQTLIHADRLDRAERWSALISSEVRETPATTWRALFGYADAEVALRRGDLPGALSAGRAALSQLTPAGWGVLIGAPLAVLVLAATAAGRYDEAQSYLDQPTPPTLFRTPFGLKHLHARGRFYAATDRPQEALAAFCSCGELMRSWRMDLPAIVPWRADAARTYLRLGQPEQARALLPEPDAASPHRPTRGHAMLLRVLAAAGEPERRSERLIEAVEAFRAVGDRLEEARCLVDLARALESDGDAQRSRETMAEAIALARACGADLDARPFTTGQQPDALVAVATGPSMAKLTETERRVAALAARGLTNREISAQLYVTMSTVEQHLTRIYRKLEIRRRTELPPGEVAV